MSSPSPVRVPAWIALGGAVLVGVLTAIQGRMNGQLGARLGDGFVAAAISFGSGFVLLLVLSLVLASGRRGVVTLIAGVRERRIPLWMLLGGAAGALTVATQSLTIGLVGVALFTVGLVAGQTLGGLFLDRIGFGPAGVVAVTLGRLVGAALILVAVGISLIGGTAASVPWWMLVLPVLAGAGIAWQQGTNGRLRRSIGNPLTATLVNFAGGSLILVIAALIHVALVGAPGAFPPEVWLYLGGTLGVVYIVLSAVIVAQTGVLLLGLGAVVGQLLTSVLLDLAWPAPASPAPLVQLATLAVALVSVVVAAVPWRRPHR